MNSLNTSLTVKIGGNAKGTTLNPDQKSAINLALASMTFTSTGTTSGKANNILLLKSRSLAASANETWTLTNFTNLLGDTAQSLTKCRGIVVFHHAASIASSITVGNAATPFAGLLNTAATTRTLAAGAGFVEWSATAAGMTVGAGQGVKVANNDGANAATYTIAFWGE